MFRSTNVPFDQSSIQPMFHSTNVPFDQSSIRPMFHSTKVSLTKVHSTKVSSTKVPQPCLFDDTSLSRWKWPLCPRIFLLCFLGLSYHFYLVIGQQHIDKKMESSLNHIFLHSEIFANEIITKC